jgi:hypothetical protein
VLMSSLGWGCVRSNLAGERTHLQIASDKLGFKLESYHLNHLCD